MCALNILWAPVSFARRIAKHDIRYVTVQYVASYKNMQQGLRNTRSAPIGQSIGGYLVLGPHVVRLARVSEHAVSPH